MLRTVALTRVIVHRLNSLHIMDIVVKAINDIMPCILPLQSMWERQDDTKEEPCLCVQHTGANTPEVKSLKEGEYVGVRRFTRILERGTEAKADLDKVIDRCGGLVNLRTAIMRYRKPRRWFRFYRSDHHFMHGSYVIIHMQCNRM